MTAAIVIGIATLAGVIVLAFGRRSRIGDAIGLGGLAAVTLVALTIGPGSLVLGSDAVVGTAYLRLFLVLGGAASTLLALIGLIAGGPTSVAGVALLALAGGGMALAVTDPLAAILASTAAAMAAAVFVADRRSGPRITVAARAVRATVVGGLLAFGGVVWLATAHGGPAIPGLDGGGAAEIPAAGANAGVAFGPGLIGLAYLAATLGLAVRLGAIPFHGWSARIAEVTPPAGLPATLAIGPAALSVVVIAWLDGYVGTLGEPLVIERWVILALGAMSLVFGAMAAWLHDDVEHVIAYSLVQDAGVILLATAALDPAAWAPVRLWILAVIVVKSALAAWAAATRQAFATRRVPELSGWARRSPLLALGFVIILVAVVGLPGLAAFDARAELIAIVADGPFAWVLLLAAIAPLVYLGRILAVGFGPPSHFVRDAPTARLAWPRPSATGDPREATTGGGERPSPRLIGAGIDAIWRANRPSIAAALVLVLASLAFLTSAGGFGATRAAAEAAPIRGSGDSVDLEGPGEAGDETGTSPDPSGQPVASPLASDSGVTAPSATGPPDSTGVPGTSGPGSSPSGTPTGSGAPADPSAAQPGASPPPSFAPLPTILP